MLVEATALACAGQSLLKPTPEKRFFVVTIHLADNMVVSIYLYNANWEDNVGHKPVSVRSLVVMSHSRKYTGVNPPERLGP